MSTQEFDSPFFARREFLYQRANNITSSLISGKFWKLGNNFGLWKLRNYEVTLNQYLNWYDPDTNEKLGSLSLKSFVVAESDLSKAKAGLVRVSICLRLLSTIQTNNSSTTFEIAFETEDAARYFLIGLPSCVIITDFYSYIF